MLYWVLGIIYSVVTIHSILHIYVLFFSLCVIHIYMNLPHYHCFVVVKYLNCWKKSFE